MIVVWKAKQKKPFLFVTYRMIKKTSDNQGGECELNGQVAH